jgi:hypothetical protein
MKAPIATPEWTPTDVLSVSVGRTLPAAPVS